MRLFFAIDLDAPARAAAERVGILLAGRAAGLGASIRWVRPAKLHLTLAFLGDVPDPSTILRALAAAPFAQPPFRLSLSVAGVFPSSGAPRVVWMGPGRGGEQAAVVARLLWRRLEDRGYGPGPPRFEPHVTLGRVRRLRTHGGRRLRAALAETALPPISWTVDRISLYQSRLESEGSTYHRLATAALEGGAA
ncbi:MAG: RNA 2',3'-cyclic phosphodiesterase [Acidobacteria bacterium]|nr:RNA 2',3'-cyclic phosphodiesterase [Acidobacteriota bacterium]